ncbi:hypothetical protein OA92_13860 [Marinomonas sp. SBI22]|uniref:hypothetical protein n=1 Tax=unclassified Marinomonas TaxID=196814 RepID=UPI0007AFC51B|nr:MULTISPECIES: hypothetical protein [unclassified Marinomonas]KZM41486.1 hypothetical protein OA92_13860 [Marinomonas sp. SBI22]KZM43322.1 hypothetical protein OA91_12065 [Marinomonas sp. SBI8L]
MRQPKVTFAFISLPVLLLFLFVISLSYQFNQKQSQQRQWRYQQAQVLEEQLIWRAFEFQIVSNVGPSQASDSTCAGFCILDIGDLATAAWPNVYEYQDESLVWIFEKYLGGKSTYRLCAKAVLHSLTYCWWLTQSDGQLYWFASLPINH